MNNDEYFKALVDKLIILEDTTDFSHLLFSEQNDSPQTIGFHNRFMSGERRQRVVYIL